MFNQTVNTSDGGLVYEELGLETAEGKTRYRSFKVKVDMKILILLLFTLFIIFFSPTQAHLSENELLADVLSDDRTIVGGTGANMVQSDRKAICRKLRKMRKQDDVAMELFQKLCKCKTTPMTSPTPTLMSTTNITDIPDQILFVCSQCEINCEGYNSALMTPYYCRDCYQYCKERGVILQINVTIVDYCGLCKNYCVDKFDAYIDTNCRRCITDCKANGIILPDLLIRNRSQLSEKCNWCRDSCRIEMHDRCPSCISECQTKNDFDGPMEVLYNDVKAKCAAEDFNCRIRFGSIQVSYLILYYLYDACAYWEKYCRANGINFINFWTIGRLCKSCEKLCYPTDNPLPWIEDKLECVQCISFCKANGINIPDFYVSKHQGECSICRQNWDNRLICRSDPSIANCTECREACKYSNGYNQLTWPPKSVYNFSLITQSGARAQNTLFSFCDGDCTDNSYLLSNPIECQDRYAFCLEAGLFGSNDNDVSQPIDISNEFCNDITSYCYWEIFVLPACYDSIGLCKSKGLSVDDFITRTDLSERCYFCRDACFTQTSENFCRDCKAQCNARNDFEGTTFDVTTTPDPMFITTESEVYTTEE